MQVLHEAGTVSRRHTAFTCCYGRSNRVVEIATGTAVWYRSGSARCAYPMAAGARSARRIAAAKPFSPTNLDAPPRRYPPVVRLADGSWRSHCRKSVPISVLKPNASGPTWAIMRTTPALLGLVALVTLWAHDIAADKAASSLRPPPGPKSHCTFSDAIAAVRRKIWHHQVSFRSRSNRNSIKIPRQLWHQATNALAYAA